MTSTVYDLDWLRKLYRSGKKIKYLYFWGHTPSGQVSAACLSQWYHAPFEADGVLYATAEHYMMAHKAQLFGDETMFEQIVQSRHPKQAKDLGRQIQRFDQTVWDAQRSAIVVAGNYHKFHQNPTLGAFLLGTQNRVLVEASPVDKIWGVGLAQGDAGLDNPLQWKGLNLLGFALMQVRDLLRDTTPS